MENGMAKNKKGVALIATRRPAENTDSETGETLGDGAIGPASFARAQHQAQKT